MEITSHSETIAGSSRLNLDFAACESIAFFLINLSLQHHHFIKGFRIADKMGIGITKIDLKNYHYPNLQPRRLRDFKRILFLPLPYIISMNRMYLAKHCCGPCLVYSIVNHIISIRNSIQ